MGRLHPPLKLYPLAPPAIAWQQILRQFIRSAGRVGKQSTWKREHRRFGQTTPGIRKQQYLNPVVAVDVSDSTDTQALGEAFAQELLHIARARKSRITARQYNYRDPWETSGRVNDLIDAALLYQGHYTELPKGYTFFQKKDTEENLDSHQLQQVNEAIRQINPKLFILQHLTGDLS